MDPAPPRRETLLDLFEALPNSVSEYIVYDDGFRPRSYSYREVRSASLRLAERLASLGIGPGDRVLLWSENSPAWVAAFWAAVLVRSTVVPIDEAHSVAFLERVRTAVTPKLLLAGQHVDPSRLTGLPVIRLADLDWPAVDAVPPDLPKPQPDDAVEILFTSGATAEPKGVVITHRNVLANTVPVEGEILKYRHYARPFSPIRFLNLLPLSHMFGQAMALFIPPMLEGTVVFQRSHSPAEIMGQIHDRRISVLICVPRILDVLREFVCGRFPETRQPGPAGEKFWWAWWRYRRSHRAFGWKFWSFVVGGAALDGELERFWNSRGFAVIQGYGLTEAAPIVTLNHPFNAKAGTVGKPIHGVEVRIAADGEVLVRGANVTRGYFHNAAATSAAFDDGWFHTGDIGDLDESGRLRIKGRKKEMIVLADGRNVFPEDVERVLNRIVGVRESAVVATTDTGCERVHAVLVLETNADAAAIVGTANRELEEHQKIHGFTVWPEPALPRTEGTEKLKRREIAARVRGAVPTQPATAHDPVGEIVAKLTGGRDVSASTGLASLGLTSLDRVELLVALEQQTGKPIDDEAFARARTIGDLAALGRAGSAAPASPPFAFPSWNRALWASAIRAGGLHLLILPLARVFAWVRAEGLEHLRDLDGPVLFAANHQGYFDTPSILAALPMRWRLRLTPAVRKEFFDAHFHPERFGRVAWLRNSIGYWLAALFFSAVPIPQREAGARRTMQYLGDLAADGYSPLIFPEGVHSPTDDLLPFQPGVAMIAAKLSLPVVPVRIRGSNHVLHPSSRVPRPGRVTVRFGAPLRLTGSDYAAMTAQVEAAIRGL